MPEYIEREELINQIRLMVNRSSVGETSLNDISAKTICGLILEAPTADVVEVKHGEWEEYWDNDYMEYFHRCSKCKNDAPAKRDTYCDQVLTNYCPNCGAKMDLKG